MLLRKSLLVLIRLNKSAFNNRILSRIIQINLVNQRIVSSFILIFIKIKPNI